MAKPTNVIARTVTTPEDKRATAREALLEGASDNSPALREALALLQSLHQRGILDALVALFEKGDDVLGIAMDTLAQPAYSSGAKNALVLAQTLSALDEETMARSQRMVVGGVRGFANARPPAKPLGVFDLLRVLKDPDVSAGLAATLGLLKGIGAAQRQRGEQ
ncbi:MAG TPA: DUF1641 domain-containing protein [Ktedonobacterales bacterium]|jgi:uncharacterized protein YjgD (DUF1641 family)